MPYALSLSCFRKKQEDSPVLVITSCPGWEKAPGGEGEGAAAMLVLPGCPSLPVGLGPRGSRVLGPWTSSPCKQPGLAAVLSNLGSALLV